MKRGAYLVAMAGYAIAIAAIGYHVVYRSRHTAEDRPAAPPDRGMLTAPPVAGGPTIQFRWEDLRRMEVFRGLEYLSERLGVSLGLADEWRTLKGRFDSGDPMTLDELRFVIERMRLVTLRAWQLAKHREHELLERQEPKRQHRRDSRLLEKPAQQWSVETPQSDMRFERLRLTNRGGQTVADVRLRVNGRPRWHTIEELIADAVPTSGSDRRRALALYKFFVENRFHNAAHGGAEMHDPVKLFGIWGYGICDDVSRCFTHMATRAGLKARVWSLQGHVVPEAYFDGAWHVLDVDIGTYFPLPDGRTLASVEQLARSDPALLRRAYEGLVSSRQLRTYVDAFRSVDDNQVVDHRWQSHDRFHVIRVDLRPDEQITWTRENDGTFFTSVMWYPPRRFSTIQSDWQPRSRAALALCRWEPEQLRVSDTPEGVVLRPVRDAARIDIPFAGSYPLLSGRFECTVRRGAKGTLGVAVQAGARGWLTLTDQAFLHQSDRMVSLLDPFIANGNGTPDYALTVRLDLCGDVQVSGIRLILTGQVATVSLPDPAPGPNRFDWSCRADDPRVALEYEWSEGRPFDVLVPPQQPEHPRPDQVVASGRAVELRWPAATRRAPAKQADGPLADVTYQVQVSADSDMLLPIAPQLDQTTREVHWTAPPGWLSGGQTYFWRVRARHESGTWSPYSPVFRFRTAGRKDEG